MKLTQKSLKKLAEAIRDAYREECRNGTCNCITVEEHESRLASK